MAIPDAPSGGEDKSLSDIYENARPDLHLPESLHAEAHTDSLPITAPDSNVLPKVTLAKPVEVATAGPIVAPQLDAPAQPVQVADSTITSLPTYNPTPNALVLGNSGPPIISARPVEVATAGPIAAPQLDAPAQPVQVADSTITSLPTYNPTPNALVLGNSGPPIISARPVEVATAGPIVAPQLDAPAQPVQVADSTITSLPTYNPTPNALVLGNSGPPIISARPVEVATAGPIAAPQLDAPAQPVQVADSTITSLPTYNPTPNALVLGNSGPPIISARPVEVATAGPIVAPQLDAPAQPVQVADSTITSLPTYNPTPNALVLGNSGPPIISARPVEVATAGPIVAPQLDAPAQPVQVADSTITSLPTYNPTPNALVLGNSGPPIISARPVEVATAGPIVAPQLDAPAQPVQVADSTITSLPTYNPTPNALVLGNSGPPTISARPVEVATAGPIAAPQLENLQRAARTAEASTTPHQTLVASSSVDTGRTAAESIINKKAGSGSPPDQTNFQYVARDYVSAAPSRVETPTPIPPAQRIHSQLAMAKEVTPDPASPIQSYPHSKNTKTAAESSPSTSATPDTLSTKRAALNPTHSTDPQSLLVALETPIRGLKSIQPTSSFTDGIVPVNKLGLPTLQTTAASVGLSTPTPSEGRIVQNIGQPATTDTPQTTLDPHKISSSLIPGAVGPGTFAGQQGEHYTSRTLHVPDLNLDEATHRPISDKGKPHSTTNQPIITETNIVSQNTVAEAELADLLGRTKKGEKEKSEPGKIDTSTTPASTTTKQPQTRPSNERLKHKVKASETLDDIAHRYFGDSRVATLIMEINSSILNPHVEKDAVIISLLVDTIIDIPSEAEVLKFRRQLASGKKTRANIICV